jgi:hypothetical protein
VPVSIVKVFPNFISILLYRAVTNRYGHIAPAP